MSDEKPLRRKGAKIRDDDARGTPPGAGTREGKNGGRIGNPPFVPTDEQREKVREMAKVFPIQGEHFIARLMGFSRDTLRRHFADDMEMGRAQVMFDLGSQMMEHARNGTTDKAKGNLDALKFTLARLGGWSTKVEMTGRDGGPIRHANFDLTKLSDEEKRALLPVLDKLIDSGEADGGADG